MNPPTKMNSLARSIDEVIEDITRLHRSLPPRPDVDEVEAAAGLLRAVDTEEKSRVEAIAKQLKEQKRSLELVPDELFGVQEQLQKNLVYFHSREQKREALKLIDLENTHAVFDELVQRAEKCLVPSSYGLVEKEPKEVISRRSSEFGSRDGSYLEKGKPTVIKRLPSGEDSDKLSLIKFDSEKLSLIKFASLIETSSKKGARDLNLANKLTDQVDWLPASIGKLSGLTTLNLSENQLASLPTSIGSLPCLTKLDLHSNRISELPSCIGELFNLMILDLRGNQLASIPPTFAQLAHLVELDISSNKLNAIPDAVGNLASLKKLNIEANNVEELPHTIGHCASLVELRADYNRLKGLPEAVGRLESLEILSVRYNNIKSLPTTMASLAKLKELDVSFNELESIPESLCLATTLVKLNVGNNFADLRLLPRSIGNLEMLEELDISNNQIKALPDSFGMLSHLRVLRLEENPLDVPPRHITQMEAQAVVEYMAEFVAKRAIKLQPLKAKNSCTQFCFFSRPNKRKHDDFNYRRS